MPTPILATLTEIRRRSERIGVSIGRLAKAAGLSPVTPYKYALPRRRTLLRLTAALTERERDLLAHLAELHPAMVDDLARQLSEEKETTP